ncbi:MAG: sigma-70 family RNA polymerase sigma factor, partial [Oscillospiraceae bacterium]|nr:sigma-70 family RNA polymerase sigma factor [Oscillospiraceae bacterium]
TRQSPYCVDTVAEWYEKYRADVYRLAFMMTKQSALSEDICQEVFLAATQRAAELKGAPGLKSWLLTVTRNKTLNALRHESYSSPLTDDLQDDRTLTDDPDFVFLDILRPLGGKERQIVLYHVAYRLSHKDIAGMLGMSGAAVRKSYSRAMKTLKSNMSAGL